MLTLLAMLSVAHAGDGVFACSRTASGGHQRGWGLAPGEGWLFSVDNDNQRYRLLLELPLPPNGWACLSIGGRLIAASTVGQDLLTTTASFDLSPAEARIVSSRYDIPLRDRVRLAEGLQVRFEAETPWQLGGEMPVVLAAGPSAILLHEAIGHGMEADFNRKKISIFSDKMGKKIANEHITIVDDGTIATSRGAINIDDEGNASERTVLVEKGVLRSYIHDEISARHFGVTPTGSGRRQSFRHAPLPRMRATVMENGPHSPEEIISSVDRGIYCISFGNGQVNIGGGDFAFYMKHGYLIEDGKLTRPIKDVNIIGNGPEALGRIEMVGNDLKIDEGGWTCGKDGQGVPVSQGMPTVLVSSLVVGGVG